MELLKDDLEAAKKLSMDSLHMSRRLHEDGGAEFVLGKALFALARVAHANRDRYEALNYHKECLEIRQGIFGSEADHSSIAESLHFLPAVQFEIGAMAEAIENAERSVGMYRRVYSFNERHPRTADSECSLMKLESEFEERESKLRNQVMRPVNSNA